MRVVPGFEEDGPRRSRFIRELMLQQLSRPRAVPASAAEREQTIIPKTLVRFWHDPHRVPADVRSCMESWDALRREGFEFRTFDDASAAAYIEARYGARERAAFGRCAHPAMRSDYLRTCFVLADGGLYVDADDVLLGDGWSDVFCDAKLKLQPLCYDANVGGMTPGADLRRVDLPTHGRIFYVNNNPLGAPAGHPILRRALARATDKLLEDGPALEIQSTTGPGNLAVALAEHARESQPCARVPDFEFLFDWERTAEPCWELSYRRDSRNWRNVFADA